MFEELAPAGAHWAEGPVLHAGWEVESEELAHAQTFPPKRRAEFLTGRAYARRALRSAGLPAPALLPGPDRAPLWPAGSVGSLSHMAGFCVAVVAEAARFRSLGVDVEAVGRLSADAMRRVLTAAEAGALSAFDPSIRAEWASRIFCAKEALYKLLHPLTKTWLGFQDAVVTMKSQEEFIAALGKDLPGGFSAGDVFSGRWKVCEGKAAACIGTPPRKAPDR